MRTDSLPCVYTLCAVPPITQYELVRAAGTSLVLIVNISCHACLCKLNPPPSECLHPLFVEQAAAAVNELLAQGEAAAAEGAPILPAPGPPAPMLVQDQAGGAAVAAKGLRTDRPVGGSLAAASRGPPAKRVATAVAAAAVVVNTNAAAVVSASAAAVGLPSVSGGDPRLMGPLRPEEVGGDRGRNGGGILPQVHGLLGCADPQNLPPIR